MRWLSFTLFLLSCAPCALAAPTCQTQSGDTIRCSVPGAMPVGWKPSPQQIWDREISRPTENNLSTLIKTVGGLALFFTMIALLPKFDGSKDSDWEPQQDDDEK